MTLEFPLDQTPTAVSMAYRPWSTQSLKLQVTTNTPLNAALRLRSGRIRPEDAAQKIIRGFADDSDAFIVSWGGGHEPGPCVIAEDFLAAFEKCVPLKPGQTSTIFFNLSHVGPDLPETAVLHFEAYNETDNQVISTLTINLQKPPDYKADAIQFQEATPGLWQPMGKSVAQYGPRWWPVPVQYETAPDLPLVIQQDQSTLLVKWNNKIVATIKDTSNPSLVENHPEALSFELFKFDEWHVALRIWFFWLDLNISGGLNKHEVPDAERFDLLIRQRDGVVTLACTDLHWRETWGRVVGEPLRATVGLNRETVLELAKEKLGGLWGTWRREKKLEHKRPYNPIEYIGRMAETLAKPEGDTVRGKGNEAHLPAMHNVEQVVEPGKPPRMTSSDVRLG